ITSCFEGQDDVRSMHEVIGRRFKRYLQEKERTGEWEEPQEPAPGATGPVPGAAGPAAPGATGSTSGVTGPAPAPVLTAASPADE
ncbi:excinuclease ABC subunit C, partial [Streptomyces sp. SID8455]|nr:excinuclease ABC subunit C [Streptomyces sp. SID8455]